MKVRKFLLPILILLLFGTYVSAHPGSTDGDGGHFDHSSGEYHYHHGYPAHEHSDGDCPYDFDDKTNYEDYDEDYDEDYEYFYDENGDRYTAYSVDEFLEDHDIVPSETEPPIKYAIPEKNVKQDRGFFYILECIVGIALGIFLAWYLLGMVFYVLYYVVYCPIRYIYLFCKEKLEEGNGEHIIYAFLSIMFLIYIFLFYL